MLGKAPHLAVAAETEIGAAAVNLDLAHQHAAAVPDIDPVAAAGIDVAEDVAFDAVGRARVGVGEHAPVRRVRLLVLPEDRVSVDSGGAARVLAAVAVDQVRIGDVDRVFGGREADAVRSAEAVGHHADVARGRVEPVDLLRELRFWPESLFVAVVWVGEPQRTVGMDNDVVGRVEWPRVVVVEEGRGFVRPLGFHVH